MEQTFIEKIKMQKMKLLLLSTAIIAMIATIGCKKYDNVSAPNVTLTGRLVYDGDSIGVADNQVPLQLYQYGFGAVGPVNLTFTQQGGFSQVLYAGDYKLIIPNGQGPFLWKKTAAGNPDTLDINIKGNMSVDVPVTPYYMIRNPQFTKSGNNIVATFKAEKIIKDANAQDIEFVGLYINKTMFVSNITDELMTNSDNSPTQTTLSTIPDLNNISLSVEIPTIPVTQNYVFARVGIKIQNVEDMIFSPVVKVNL